MSRRVITDDDLYPVPTGGQPTPTAPQQTGVYPAPPQPWETLGAADVEPVAAEHRSSAQWVAIGGLLLAFFAVAAGAFFGGQATRPSDADVASQIRHATDRARAEERTAADRRLAEQRAELTRARNRAVAKAQAAARRAGINAGVAQGVAQGTADGTQRGREIGRDEGLAENVCGQISAYAAC